MRKFILVIFIFLLVAAGAAWYFLLLKPTAAFTENSTFKAVPIHSPLVIELQNTDALIQSFSGGNMIIDELKNTGIVNEISREIQFMSELKKSNPDFDELCKGKSVLISANFEGKNELDFIFLVSLKDKKEQSLILEIIKQLSDQSNLSKRNYDNAEIYRVTTKSTTFSFAFTNGIFVASKKAVLVEEAVRQSNAESLLDHPDFVKLNKTSNSNASANIYINHGTITQLLAKSLNKDIRKKIGFLANFAEYTELDLNLKKDELFLSGYTFSNDSSESYINLFKGQAPERSNLESVLPSNTSLFISMNIEIFSEFLQNYEEFSRKKGSYYQREARLMTVKNEAKTDFIKVVTEIATGVSGIAFTSVTQNEPDKNRFFITEIKSQSIGREKMELILTKYLETKKIDAPGWRSNYQIDENRSFTFYQFPYPDIAEVLFGKIYSGVQCNFFTFFDNYLIFADSHAALKEFIHNLVLGETLSKDINYLKFKENTSSKSNLHFYVNFSKAFHLSRQYLNQERLNNWISNEESIRKFYAFSWQFSNTNELILNNIYLKFDPVIKEEPQTIWQTKIEGNLRTRPKMVVNHNDPDNKEVIFQDQANNLYLINKEGVTLWKVTLPEPIISDINQIDIYRNNKYQYLFNTKSQIYLVDRNGENVKGYPVALRSPATNGIAVVDYDNNKDYRYFIACENKQVYAYSKDGKFVKGWSNFVSDNSVEKPLKHMRVLNKDYIAFFDRYKTYFLDRQGKIRLETKATFEHSGNELILENAAKPVVLCTDKNGAVYKLYFDGSFEKLELASLSSNHHFTSEDINGNGLTDFIFADKNQLIAFSEAGKKLFSKEFKKPISEKPEIFSFGGKNKKIGVVTAEENRIYLFNSDGSIYKGFPLLGNSGFCIGTLSKGNKFFNLLIGNEDHSFFNYMIE